MDANIVGNADGIALWQRMSVSNNAKELEYFNRLVDASTKYGKVWFSDLLKQEETCANQTIYYLEWDSIRWTMSVFMTPDPTPIQKKEIVVELDESDIVYDDDVELDFDEVVVQEL